MDPNAMPPGSGGHISTSQYDTKLPSVEANPSTTSPTQLADSATPSAPQPESKTDKAPPSQSQAQDEPIRAPSPASNTPSHHAADIERTLAPWLCAVGSLLFLIPSYGWMHSTGLIQAYIQENQLRAYSARDLGWISGTFTFLGLFLGIQTGPLMDAYGPAKLAPIATIISVPMFFFLAECETYWQFMLCQGVLGGIGAALSSTVAVSIVGKLFTRYRGMAMGIALVGSSLGGILFPIMLRSTFPTMGWKWSMRLSGFLSLGVMVPAVLCFLPFPRLMGERLNANSNSAVLDEVARTTSAPRPEEGAGAGDADVTEAQQSPPTEARAATPKKRSAALNLSAFKTPPFSLVTGAMFLLEFVIFGVAGILPTLVAWAGFPPDTGFNMIAIINALSCLGRVATGWLGDRSGHFNILLGMIVLGMAGTACTLAPFGSTHIAALYAFSVVWGFSSGSFLSVVPVCVGKTCEPKDYGRYFGTMTFVVSFGLLITVPIGGEMLETMGSEALSGLYVALLFLAGGGILAARALLLGSWLDYRANI